MALKQRHKTNNVKMGWILTETWPTLQNSKQPYLKFRLGTYVQPPYGGLTIALDTFCRQLIKSAKSHLAWGYDDRTRELIYTKINDSIETFLYLSFLKPDNNSKCKIAVTAALYKSVLCYNFEHRVGQMTFEQLDVVHHLKFNSQYVSMFGTSRGGRPFTYIIYVDFFAHHHLLFSFLVRLLKPFINHQRVADSWFGETTNGFDTLSIINFYLNPVFL